MAQIACKYVTRASAVCATGSGDTGEQIDAWRTHSCVPCSHSCEHVFVRASEGVHACVNAARVAYARQNGKVISRRALTTGKRRCAYFPAMLQAKSGPRWDWFEWCWQRAAPVQDRAIPAGLLPPSPQTPPPATTRTCKGAHWSRHRRYRIPAESAPATECPHPPVRQDSPIHPSARDGSE